MRGVKGENDPAWGKKVASQLGLKEINRDVLDGELRGKAFYVEE